MFNKPLFNSVILGENSTILVKILNFIKAHFVFTFFHFAVNLLSTVICSGFA